MLRRVALAAFCALCWASPGQGEARIEAALQSFLPVNGITIAQVDIEAVTPERVEAQNILARWEEGTLSIQELQISHENGLIEMDLEGLRLLAPGRRDLRVNLSGRFGLSAIPRLPAHPDWICRLAQISRHVELREIRVEWDADDDMRRRISPDFLPHLRGESISLEANPDPVACRFQGRISTGPVDIRSSTSTLTRLHGLDVEADIALNIETARADPGDFQLDITANGLERTDRREIPQVGIPKLRMSMEAPMARSLGAVVVLRNILEDPGARAASRGLLEGWNALHLMRPDIRLFARDMRLFLPGIIPPEMHANFRRAELTNAQASLNASLAFGPDSLRTEADIEITGVADLALNAELVSLAVPAEAIRSAISGAGISGLPMAELRALMLHYQDRGLDRVSTEMFGIPFARLVEEIQALLQNDEHDALFISDVMWGLSRALRIAQTGQPVRFRLSHEDGARTHVPGDLSGWISGADRPDPGVVARIEY